MGELMFVCGSGYDYAKEDGRFKVKHADRTKYFDKLSEAKAYYDNLKESKSIWGINNWPELLECHSLEE